MSQATRRSIYRKKKGPISRPHVVLLGFTVLFLHFVDQVVQTLHRKIHEVPANIGPGSEDHLIGHRPHRDPRYILRAQDLEGLEHLRSHCFIGGAQSNVHDVHIGLVIGMKMEVRSL